MTWLARGVLGLLAVEWLRVEAERGAEMWIRTPQQGDSFARLEGFGEQGTLHDHSS